MADVLASGACLCGNRGFEQITFVVFPEGCESTRDASDRARKHSPDVRKMYKCASCGNKYIFNERDQEWRKA